jgi:uncharacterized protein YukE
VTVNPLVAGRLAGPKDAWAGVWLAEDIELIGQGVRNGSWIDGGLGMVGAGLDALAAVSDPVGTLLQYGVAWLIEHIRPLSQALEWLAGDPAQIAGHVQTWRNVGASLQETVAELAAGVRADVASWRGAAADAYRVWAGQQRDALAGLVQACETMAAITEGAGFLIAAVRVMVRDAIAVVVSRAITYAAEEAFSLGLATPLVVEQVTSTVAAWAAKIARWLKAMLASLRRLLPIIRRLGEIIDELKKILNRLRGKGPGHEPGPHGKPPRTPEEEAKRIRELGEDPATGQFRQAEAETAQRVERALGIELKRSPDPNVDWVDDAGRTYDAVGNFDARYFEPQWPNLQTRIVDHLAKADTVPIDVSRFTPEQVAKVQKFIDDNGLGPRAFLVRG